MIVQNFWLKRGKKKLAGMVLYEAMDQTRGRELATSVTNPRTPDQMNQRVKWQNLVSFYRVNKSWMKYAFETKASNQSEYNKFMSVNAAASNIYFTKQLANLGACVVAPYIVTQGSLTPIEFVAQTGNWQSNIFLPSDFTLSSSTTVGAFAAAIIALNPAIQEGDQLSFIRLTQMSNADTGAPYVIMRKYEILMRSTSTALVGDFLPLDYFSLTTASGQKALSVVDSGLAGGFALILSRTTGGRTYVSSQKIVVANNEAMIASYSSAVALQNAIQSYGEGEDAFLSSNTAYGTEAAPVALAPISIKHNNVSSAAGSIVSIGDWAAGDLVLVYFNDSVLGSNVSARISTNKREPFVSTCSFSSGRVAINLPDPFVPESEEYLTQITVTIDGEAYNIIFSLPSSGGGGTGPSQD